VPTIVILASFMSRDFGWTVSRISAGIPAPFGRAG
jgi:hypothetical protein